MAKNWAIAIGINNYSSLKHLRYAKLDAEAMAAWFKTEAERQWWLHIHRPSFRHERRSDGRPCTDRGPPARCEVRGGYHVHRRRPGGCRPVRGGLSHIRGSIAQPPGRRGNFCAPAPTKQACAAVGVLFCGIMLVLSGAAGNPVLSASSRTAVAQRGFSLLELVVATAIMAMALAALYRAAGGATRTVAIDEKTAYGVELARSVLANHAVGPSDGWSDAGTTDGGYSWELTTAPAILPEDSPLPEGSLQSVRVVVRWPDGDREREFRLESIVAGTGDEQ